jgi:type IX secretion system PorP/SprF family membrane protein
MNKNIIYKLLFTAALSWVSQATAQQEQMYSHYDYNSFAVNPAYAGSKQTLVANSLVRTQWLNLPGAPRYYNLGVHSPLVGDFGGGINIQTGTIGKFKTASPMTETQLGLSGSWNKQITGDLRLAVGLRLGAYNYSLNLSQLQIDKPGDVAFQNNDFNVTAPMAGFGVYAYTNNFFAGVSAPRMLFISADNRKNMDVQYAAVTQYYLTAGYVIDAGTDLKIKPTTQVRVIQGVPVQADINVHAIYKENYSLGGFFRTGGEMGIMAMAQVNPNFTLVYSYDSRLAPLNNYVNGSHEFGLQFMIPYVSNARVRAPRYF